MVEKKRYCFYCASNNIFFMFLISLADCVSIKSAWLHFLMGGGALFTGDKWIYLTFEYFSHFIYFFLFKLEHYPT